MQKGFATIALFLITVALVLALGAGAYYLVNKQSANFPTSAAIFSASTSTDQVSADPYEPLPKQSVTGTQPAPVIKGTISVTDLLGNKDVYVGKQVNVEGRIEARVLHFAMSCPPDTQNCDTTQSGGVYLWNSTATIGKGTENNISVYKNRQIYPCVRSGYEEFICAPFKDREVTTISGTWTKARVPNSWVGGSGGGAPTPTSWKNIYYLEVQ